MNYFVMILDMINIILKIIFEEVIDLYDIFYVFIINIRMDFLYQNIIINILAYIYFAFFKDCLVHIVAFFRIQVKDLFS